MLPFLILFCISPWHSQVFLGHSGGLDTDGNELPRLVYVSREKRPGFQHHKKAGAMNALVCHPQSTSLNFRTSSLNIHIDDFFQCVPIFTGPKSTNTAFYQIIFSLMQ